MVVKLLRELKEFIEEDYGVSIFSKSKEQTHAEARGTFVHIAKKWLNISSSAIAKFINTSEPSCRTMERRLQEYLDVDRNVKMRYLYTRNRFIKYINEICEQCVNFP